MATATPDPHVGWFYCMFCTDGVPTDPEKHGAPCTWCKGVGKNPPPPRDYAGEALDRVFGNLAMQGVLDVAAMPSLARMSLRDALRDAIDASAVRAVEAYQRRGRCDCHCELCIGCYR